MAGIEKKYEERALDVLIVGGGGAAALAALEIKRAGLTVGLVTKESALVGGATIMAAGGTCAVFSPGDSPETFQSDIFKSGQYLNNAELVRRVTEGSVGGVLNLETHDFLLDRKDSGTLRTINHGEGHTFPRGYLDRREALGVCHALSKALMRNEIALFPETVLTKLLVKENRVIAAMAMSLVTGEYWVFKAKAVVLATGGLGALYKLTTNSAVLTGDGFALAFDAGAELVDMEMVQFFPIAFPYPAVRKGKMIAVCSWFGPDVKLLNGLGDRYMPKYDPERKEMSTRDNVSRANFIEIMEGRGTKNGAIVVDPTKHDPAKLLKFKTSIPHVYAMFREVYGKRVAEWEEPFEAIPSQHFFMGGVRMDEECRTNVAGLFAVGEASGGMHGANRLSGVALTEVYVMGPVAGKSAALYAQGKEFISPDARVIDEEMGRLNGLFESGNGVRPFELKAAVQDIMWEGLGPVRDGAGIEVAIGRLRRIEKEQIAGMSLGSQDRTYNRDRMEAIEVPFMIKTGLLVAHAALLRKESRGSHYRTDFTQRNDEEWLRNVVIRRNKDGDVDMRTEKTAQAKTR
ncbi:MAG: FAD-binding protein [Syntrophorhabdales bacterium]|jgi:fumarate reductase (CoM/CoB) subunit A